MHFCLPFWYVLQAIAGNNVVILNTSQCLQCHCFCIPNAMNNSADTCTNSARHLRLSLHSLRALFKKTAGMGVCKEHWGVLLVFNSHINITSTDVIIQNHRCYFKIWEDKKIELNWIVKASCCVWSQNGTENIEKMDIVSDSCQRQCPEIMSKRKCVLNAGLWAGRGQ